MASFLQTYLQSGVPDAHPHLDPVNGAAIASDCALVQQRVTGLASYQTYLAAARAAKAQRKGASLSFERAVQAQAGQALSDSQTLCGAALRVIQQVNQTSFWTRSLGRMTTTLHATGPVTAEQIWNDIWVTQTDPQFRAALQAQGLTDAVASAITSAVSQVKASFVLQDGKLAIEGNAPGSTAAVRVSLTAPGTPPANVGELLGAARFDQVVSAFTNGDPVYLEAVPAAVAVEPADIFAAGAVVARQRVADHLRKLQDTGLATQAGGGPLAVALVAILVAALVIGGIGVAILVNCDNEESQGKKPDPILCAVGEILVYLAMLMLLVPIVAGGPVVTTIAWLAFGGFLAELVANLNFILPTFQPNAAPQQ